MNDNKCTHEKDGRCSVLGRCKCRPVDCSLKDKENPSPADIYNEIEERRNPQIAIRRKARAARTVEDWRKLPENKTLFHANPGEIIGKAPGKSPVEIMEGFLLREVEKTVNAPIEKRTRRKTGPRKDSRVLKFDIRKYYESVKPEEVAALLAEEQGRKKPGHEESQLQQLCVAWFRSTFPAIAPLLIAVPNAARRNARTGAILKREGLTAGVADLILLVGRGEFHSLCIEMKTHRKGSGQSDKQIEWEQVAEDNGNKYVVCRDSEEFKIAVLNYLFP